MPGTFTCPVTFMLTRLADLSFRHFYKRDHLLEKRSFHQRICLDVPPCFHSTANLGPNSFTKRSASWPPTWSICRYSSSVPSVAMSHILFHSLIAVVASKNVHCKHVKSGLFNIKSRMLEQLYRRKVLKCFCGEERSRKPLASYALARGQVVSDSASLFLDSHGM